MVWCILHVIYVYIETKKVSLCHLVLWQPMICEFFPKDFSEFFNFKLISKFALIQYCFFTNSKFVVLVKQRM
jgi:hypothetical protein